MLPRTLPLLLVLLLADCNAQPPEKHIRVVTWNLAWFPGKIPDPTTDEEKAHMEKAQTTLKELRPDVLLLQEVRDWKSAEELCSVIPGLQVQVISRFGPRPQNQVIATNLPVDSTWSDSWARNEEGPPRGYSFAAIELPGKRFLLTYSLHLKSNVGPPVMNVAKRQEAMKQLLRHTDEMLTVYSPRGGCFFVVAGDMNTSMEDPRFRKEQTLPAIIASGFHWTFAGIPFAKRITIPKEGGYPDNCFDHIFTLGLGKQTAFVKPYPGVSDHHPVVLDLAVQDSPEELNVEAGLALLKSRPALPVAEKEIQVTATLNANDHDAIKAAVGKIVAVRGKVQEIGRTRSGSISFINFEGNQRGQFVGIVKKENLALVEEALGVGLKPALIGRTVEIRGEIVLYNGIPEIVVASPGQLKVVEE